MRVRIEDRNHDGRGRGTAEGRTVLVSQAHPGEVVRVRTDRVTKGTVQGRVGTLLTPDPTRIAHTCQHEFHCTGCPMLAATPESELAFKEAELARLLSGLAGTREVAPMVRPSGLFGYRHTAKQVFGRRGPRTILGSYVQATHKISDNAACPVLAPRLATLFDLLAWGAHELRLAVHSEDGRLGLRHAVARLSKATGELALLLVSSEDPPLQARALARRLRTRLPDLVGVEIGFQAGNTNTLLEATTVFVEGTPLIEEEILGFRHRLGPRSFFQVNPTAAEVLFQQAIALAGEGKRVLEAYAGVGALTFPLSRHFEQVVAIESAEASVEAHRAGLERHGITNVVCHGERAESALASRIAEFRPEVLVLDPPRSGAPTEIWSGLRDSSIQRIVYLACDPKTLVSTSNALSDQGFGLTHLVPVDQFPRTAHWELIARFDRKGESLPGSPN